jgi:imidazolonepropionase-like amidohydrolase
MIAHLLAAALALTHVTTIDVASGRTRGDMTVLIDGDRIAAVGKSAAIRVPAGARIVDGSGTFVIPGLWDMHVHLPDDDVGREAYLPLFVANGVTGIRVMEGSPELCRWREAVRRGEMLGPRMIVASAILDGPQAFLPDAIKVSTPAEARNAVREAKRQGADFVKVYDHLSPAAYRAIVFEARRQRLPVAGHVPLAMSVEEVSKAGQRSIEHMMGIAAAASSPKKATALFALLRKNHTWECPTLIMRHNYASLDDPHLADDPCLVYVKPSTRKRWLGMLTREPDLERKRIFANEAKLAASMAKAGVGILAGTDNGNPFCLPGFSLHDELALLVDSGVTPLQALQAATINATRFLDIETTADFVVLDANPLEDIRSTKRIKAVVIRGRLLDRAALDQLLAESRAVVNR